MSIFLVLIVVWLFYPLFGIPYAISVRDKNKKLKQKIEELEFENRKLKYERAEEMPVVHTEDGEAKLNEPAENDHIPKFKLPDQSVPVRSEVLPEETQIESLPEDIETENAELRKAKNVSGLLVTGVSLVLLAGLIFVTTNWASITDGFKIFLIMLVTLLFFGTSVFAEKKLGLESTSKGFFALGTFFVPINSVSLFFYKIFGEWLSFAGEGKMLALMAVFLSCSLSCMLITKKYRNHVSAFGTLLFISASVSALGLFTGMFPVFLVIAVVFSFCVLYADRKMLDRLEIPLVYSEVFHFFAVFNVFAMAAVSLIFSWTDANSTETAAAVIMFIAATLYFQFSTDDKIRFRLFSLASLAEFLYLAVMVTQMISDSIGAADNKLKYLIFAISVIPAFIVFAFVPKLKSEITCSALCAIMFSWCMFHPFSFHPAASLIVLMFIVLAAFTVRKEYSTIAASIMSVPLVYELIQSFGWRTWVNFSVISFTVSAVFLISRVIALKKPMLRYAAYVFAGWSVFCSPAAGFSYRKLLPTILAVGVSAAVFAIASFLERVHERKNEVWFRVFSIISVSEYIIFAHMFTTYILKDAERPEKCLVFALMTIPAFALYTFIPKFRSDIVQYIMCTVMILWSLVQYNSNHPVACAVVLLYLILTACTERKPHGYIIAVCFGIPLLYQMLITLDMSSYHAALVLSVLVTVMFVFFDFISEKFKGQKYTADALMYWQAAIPVLVSSVFSDKLPALLSLALSSVVFGVTAYRREFSGKNSFCRFLSVVTSVQFQLFVFLISDRVLFRSYSVNFFTDNVPMYLASMLAMGIVAGTGFLLRRSSTIVSKAFVYTSLLLPAAVFIIYTPDSESHWGTAFGCILIAYFILCGMISYGNNSKVFYTIASAATALVAVLQNIIPVAELVRPEYIVICTFIPYIFMFRIWKDERSTLWDVLFVHSCVAMGALGVTAVLTSELFHVIIMGTACVAVIMITVVTGSRRWSILGTVTLVVLVFYATRGFWTSAAWWVYLLITGIILIAYAAMNEYYRKTGKENIIKASLKAFFEFVFSKDRSE